ncbi:uncharacterized protein LOC121712273 isoform X2 [Alosa sapidissima]|uniref:uncharacterized protein LOC121712273 isoform X2 n=1 Tax=Alosa sapidissima TaxID=34773 RepID=UPI001C08047B|nr:uncharacterized protein LOC121712273 isoform X2 [Alosa sapidissima]
MDKEKTTKRMYREKLNATAKQRYLEKLCEINQIDPYELSAGEWSRDMNALPPCTYMDMVNYLVYGVSYYTKQQFKCYKSLESHEQFCCGWVQDLQIYKPGGCKNTVVLAKVMHSQRLSQPPLTPWVILAPSGEVVSAHCTCMAGVAESCTHVGALFFKVEASVPQ